MPDARTWRTSVPYVPPRSTGSWRTHDQHTEPREDCWRCR